VWSESYERPWTIFESPDEIAGQVAKAVEASIGEIGPLTGRMFAVTTRACLAVSFRQRSRGHFVILLQILMSSHRVQLIFAGFLIDGSGSPRLLRAKFIPGPLNRAQCWKVTPIFMCIRWRTGDSLDRS